MLIKLGIGLSIAKALASNGARRVYILGRRLDKLQEAANLSPSSNITPIQADVTSKDDLSKAATQILNEAGYINLLVCNSGVGGPSYLTLEKDASPEQIRDYIWANWSQEDFSKTLEVNVTSALFTAVAFLPLLDKGNSAGNVPGVSSQVIITASVSSFLRHSPTGFAYSISKSAVNHLAKMLSTFLMSHRIRVNALNPGTFKSKQNKYIASGKGHVADYEPSAELTDRIIGKVPGFTDESIPEKRLGNEIDLAGAALFLSSKAGSFLNGLSLVIDGGILGTLPGTY